MEGIVKYKSLSEIPSASYDGYIWMSNEDKPKLLNKVDFSDRNLTLNPFIVEGLLFDEENNKSIHITHDGDYTITVFDINKFTKPTFEVVEKKYLPHRLDGVNKVCFKQIWMEKAEENSADFPVLKLQATIFSGFKK
jgi:CRISPR type III-associated protein (TIGR04423 family)